MCGAITLLIACAAPLHTSTYHTALDELAWDPLLAFCDMAGLGPKWT